MSRFAEDTETDDAFAPTLEDEGTTNQNEEAAVSATLQENENQIEDGPSDTEPKAGLDAETPSESKPEKKAEEPVDISKFTATVETAVQNANADGSPADEGIAAVQEAYHGLEGARPKAAARKWMQESTYNAVRENDTKRAYCVMRLDETMKEGGAKKSGGSGEGTPRKPADPTEAYVSSVVGLSLALSLVQASKPEGVAEDAETQVEAKFKELYASTQEYLTWLGADKESRGDEPEADDLVKNAARLALGKKTRTSSGPATPFTGERKDVSVHIAQAFEGEPVGKFLKVADIVSFKSREYGDRTVSAGAVSQRIDKNKLPEGLRPATVDGVKGVEKHA